MVFSCSNPFFPAQNPTQAHSRQQTRATFLPSVVTLASSWVYLFEDFFALVRGLLQLTSLTLAHSTTRQQDYIRRGGNSKEVHKNNCAMPRELAQGILLLPNAFYIYFVNAHLYVLLTTTAVYSKLSSRRDEQ